jgi:hypothetical protein
MRDLPLLLDRRWHDVTGSVLRDWQEESRDATELAAAVSRAAATVQRLRPSQDEEV